MPSVSLLTEDRDIPGASLAGRKPIELKNEELKFWLRCRGDPGKGLKTKAELMKWFVLFTFSFRLIHRFFNYVAHGNSCIF